MSSFVCTIYLFGRYTKVSTTNPIAFDMFSLHIAKSQPLWFAY